MADRLLIRLEARTSDVTAECLLLPVTLAILMLTALPESVSQNVLVPVCNALFSYLSCDGHFPDLSSSPPGPYQQDAYVVRSEDKLKHPPFLPPHLLQVLLNKDTGISVSMRPLLRRAARHAFTLCSGSSSV